MVLRLKSTPIASTAVGPGHIVLSSSGPKDWRCYYYKLFYLGIYSFSNKMNSLQSKPWLWLPSALNVSCWIFCLASISMAFLQRGLSWPSYLKGWLLSLLHCFFSFSRWILPLWLFKDCMHYLLSFLATMLALWDQECIFDCIPSFKKTALNLAGIYMAWIQFECVHQMVTCDGSLFLHASAFRL